MQGLRKSHFGHTVSIMTRAKTLSAAAFEPHCVLCRCRCGGDTWETTLKPSFIFFPSAYTWTGARSMYRLVCIFCVIVRSTAC